MLRMGSNGNVAGRWVANLPVCRIFRRGIDVYSSFSLRSGEAEFMQLFPLQVPYAAEQSNPVWEPQSDLKLNLTISNKDA